MFNTRRNDGQPILITIGKYAETRALCLFNEGNVNNGTVSSNLVCWVADCVFSGRFNRALEGVATLLVPRADECRGLV